MTRETKIGLLIGVALILLVSVVVTDYLSVASRQPAADLTQSGQAAEESVIGRGADSVMSWWQGEDADARTAENPSHQQPIPTPQELAPQRDRSIYTPTQRRSTPSPRIAEPSSDGPIAGRTPYQPYHNEAEVTPPEVPAEARQRVAERQRPSVQVADAQNARDAKPIIHYVKSGENLYKLADRYYGNGEYWHSIAQANDDIDNQSGQIAVGQRVVIPNFAGLAQQSGSTSDNGLGQRVVQPSSSRTATLVRTTATPKKITVQKGDTLYALASKYLGDGNKWRQILEANRQTLPDAESLRPGMKLVMPNTQQRVVSQPSTSSAGRRPETRTLAATTSRRSASNARPTLSGARFVPVSNTAATSVVRPSPFDGSSKRHTVRSGESLASIARRYYGDAEQWPRIFQANKDRLPNENVVPVGTVLVVPGR